jgi:hypothetical protein
VRSTKSSKTAILEFGVKLEIVDSLSDGLRLTPGKEAVLEVLLSIYEGLDRKMKSSGVFHLYACLWPVPAEEMPLRILAASELEYLVIKQWHMWQNYHNVIALPAEYLGDGDNLMLEFISKASAQLTNHVVGNLDINIPRMVFKLQAANREAALRGGV